MRSSRRTTCRHPPKQATPSRSAKFSAEDVREEPGDDRFVELGGVAIRVAVEAVVRERDHDELAIGDATRETVAQRRHPVRADEVVVGAADDEGGRRAGPNEPEG